MVKGQNAAVPMCRRSSWTDPTYKAPTPGWGSSAKHAADYGIAIAKPQAIAIGQMRDAAGEVMNIAIRNGDRAAIQAAADKAAEFMTALVAKTETGMDFIGVMPSLGKRMKPGVQQEPIAADGMDKLGQ
jgi:hypothetical protein